MAREVINIGTRPNDRTGDSWRTAATKINNMTEELYTATAAIPDVADILTVDDLVTDLTTDSDVLPAAASTVKDLKDQFDALTTGGGIPAIANNLTTTTTGSTLDATQGKALKDITDGLDTRLDVVEAAGYAVGSTLVSTYGSDTILNSSASLLSTSRRMSFVERGVGIMVDVSGIGTGGNITTRIQNALALIPTGGTIIIPNGSWTVTVDTIRLNNNQSVRGESIGGVNLTTNTANLYAQHAVFMGQAGTTTRNISITGLNVTSANQDYLLYRASGDVVEGLYIADCKLTYCRVTFIQSASSYITIERCRGTGGVPDTQGQGQFINLAYCTYFWVRDCYAIDYMHGFQGQGGAGAILYDITSDRGCRYGWIENCRFDGGGASIWFAACSDITIRNCYGNRNLDASFDAEGCFRITWDNCHSVDPGLPGLTGAIGAGFSTLYSTQSFWVINCSCRFVTTAISTVTETLGQTVLAYGGGKGSYFYTGMGGNNSSLPSFQDVRIINCRFEAAAPAKDGKFARIGNYRADVPDGQPLYDSLISGNTLINGTIQLGYEKDRYYRILNNNIEIRMAAFVADAAIQIGGQNLIWPSSSQFESAHVSVINGNIITFTAAQFAGTSGIKINWPLLPSNAHQGVDIFNNDIRQAAPGSPTAIDFGIHVVNTATEPGAKWIRSGNNVLPDSYLNGGQPIKIEETGAASPISWINASRSVRAASGYDCHTLSLTSRVALTPVSVSGTNKFVLAAGATGAAALTESGIAAGDLIQTSGASTSANNGTWVVSAVTNTGTGTSGGECSITVNTVTAGDGLSLSSEFVLLVEQDGTTPGLVNETLGGTPVLSKMVRAGRTERIRVYAPTGTTIASNILRNTGIPLTQNMRYEAHGPTGSVWEYKPRCEANGTLTIYATNLRSADAVPPVETISILQTTRI